MDDAQLKVLVLDCVIRCSHKDGQLVDPRHLLWFVSKCLPDDASSLVASLWYFWEVVEPPEGKD